MENNTLYLIDTSSYLFRAYHALPYLSNSRGLPTHAILGFTTMLMKIIREHNPKYMAAVLDSKEPTFRDKVFVEYKATRPPMPEDLRIQIPYVLEIIRSLGIKIIEKSGYEADDIIATIVEHTKNSGIKIVIVGSDKDLFQLVSEDVSVLDTMKEEFITPAEVIKKFGVSPEKIPELLALTGDSTDNIPGIKGIGIKTAQRLLNEFGSIDGIYRNIDNIKQPALRKSLEESTELLKLNRTLVNLERGVDIKFDIDEYKIAGIDRDGIKKIFFELEFYRLVKEMGLVEEKKKSFHFLKDSNNITPFMKTLNDRDIAISMKSNLIAIATDETSATVLNARDRKIMDLIFERAKNIYLYDIKNLYESNNFNPDILKKFRDIKLITYLINPNNPSPDLETLILRTLGETLKNKEHETAPLFESTVAPEQVMSEACAIYEIGKIFHAKLIDEGMEKLYLDIELPLTEVLFSMEKRGILVDRTALAVFDKKLDEKITSIKSEIFQTVGEEFNIDSPKQLQQILFEKLNLPRKKRTKTGFSTDVEVLEDLARIHYVPGKILEYRSLAKIKNTYVLPLMNSINTETGRIHPRWHQDVVATGRLSCSNPNLQNIPGMGELAKELRSAFIAERNMLLVSADYSQIELRLLAHFSGDENLIKSFMDGKDIHSSTASVLFNVRENDVTPEMRRKAKVINFGIIYGMSPHGLSQELNIPYEEAETYIQEYFLKYPAVKRFIDNVIASAGETKFVRTLMGRKRPVPDILSSQESARNTAERIAVNSIMQGSAADITKMAMLRIYRRIKEQQLNAHLLLQIHDELLLEVDEKIIALMENIIREEMENCVYLKVPLRVDVSHGKTWAEISD